MEYILAKECVSHSYISFIPYHMILCFELSSCTPILKITIRKSSHLRIQIQE